MTSGLRNFLAIVLSMGVLILWYTFVAPPSSPPQRQSLPTEERKTQEDIKETASPISRKLPLQGGKAITLENDLIKISLNTQGGIITNWELKKFAPVSIVDPQGSALNQTFENANLSIPDPIPFEIVRQDSNQVELQWRSKELTVLKKIHLTQGYQMDVELKVLNRSASTVELTTTVEWDKIPKEETPQRGALFFKTPPDRWHPVFYKEGKVVETEWEKVPSSSMETAKVGWIGAKSRYFLGGVAPIAKEGQNLEMGKYEVPGGIELFHQRLYLQKIQILPNESWAQKFKVYGGPKELAYLKETGLGFEKAIGYGWTAVFAIPMLHLLKFFYRIVHNYGIAIILLTVLIKLLLNPINRKSLESMKKMQAMQPKLKELREKFGQDKEKMNMETMRLFKAHKINPMGGCLPMLVQIPIYIALYNVLWNSVELYHAPFFWFYKDLSAPDPYLITPLLLGITMFIQTKMTPTATADPAQQKMMLFMPIIFCAFMIFLPMGLGLYIFVNTLMTILQQWMYQRGIRTRDLVLGRILRS